MRLNFKFGFTLAEILIVIGVIGVVAALTIPTLIKNHQKRVWIEQLRTSVVKIQDGFRLAMAEDGVDDLGETELWSVIPSDVDIDESNYNTDGKPFLDRLSQYLKFTINQDDVFVINYLNEDVAEAAPSSLSLLNGTRFLLYPFATDNVSTNEDARLNGGAIWRKYGELVLDVNGQKGPNRSGRDIFGFYIAQNGLLYPEYGKDDVIYQGATLENYKTSNYYWNNNDKSFNCSTKVESAGMGCAARIIEEGWKMNY